MNTKLEAIKRAAEKATPGPRGVEGNKVGPRSTADDQSYGMVLPIAYIEQYDWSEGEVKANKELIALLDPATVIELVRLAEERSWIPVSEGSPKTSGNYLAVRRGNGEVVIANFESGFGFLRNVSHWMPLPAPPKEQP